MSAKWFVPTVLALLALVAWVVMALNFWAILLVTASLIIAAWNLWGAPATSKGDES